MRGLTLLDKWMEEEWGREQEEGWEGELWLVCKINEEKVGEGEPCTLLDKEGFLTPWLGDWSGAFPILPWWRKRQCTSSFYSRECVISNSSLNKYALISETRESVRAICVSTCA